MLAMLIYLKQQLKEIYEDETTYETLANYLNQLTIDLKYKGY